MNAPNAPMTVELPQPGFPMLTRVITNALLPESGREGEPIVFQVSAPHPLAPNMKVVRMFVDRGGVEIYFVSEDGRAAARNLIPMSCVRLIEEAMPLNVFIEELAAAEEGDDDEDDPEESFEDPPVVAPPNGQPSSS